MPNKAAPKGGRKRAKAAENKTHPAGTKSGYYKQIKGVKYDRELLETAESLTTGQGDGRISKDDIMKLWEEAQDSQGVTECERRTIQYIADNFKCTDAAKSLLEKFVGGEDEEEDGGMDVEEEQPAKPAKRSKTTAATPHADQKPKAKRSKKQPKEPEARRASIYSGTTDFKKLKQLGKGRCGTAAT